MRAPLLLLPLLATGCGDISNAWLLEDAEFLDALPSEARHTVALDADTAKGLGDAPELLLASYQVAQSVNRPIFEVLGAIDDVRETRPTERTADGRRWGPYPLRSGVEVEVWVERTGGGRFDWGVDAIADGDTFPYIAGTHYAGETVAEGDGQFTWTFDEVAVRAGDPARGTVEVDYDNREGVDLLVFIDGVTDGTAAPVSADYAYRALDGEGDFQYVTPWDIDSDRVFEDVSVRTRWMLGDGGRSDAVLSGGSFGAYVMRWSQCWDRGDGLVYQADDLGLVEALGAESDCRFPTFAEVDRL